MASAGDPPPGMCYPVHDPTTPFWRTDLHELDDYQSTTTIPPESDIVIIGAGMSGITTAYHLLKGSQVQRSITILEARQVSSGATGRNGGHVKLAHSHIRRIQERFSLEAAVQLAEFQIAQIYALKALVESEALDCDFVMTRSYDIVLDEAGAETMKKVVEKEKASKISVMREVDLLPADLVKSLTGVKRATGAISVPAAQLWPYKFVTGLLNKIIDRINLQTHTGVLSVSSNRDAEGYFSISTTRGQVRARTVIFASNGYTAGILEPYRKTIIPLRGANSRVVQSSDVPPMPNLRYTYNILYPDGEADYLIPRPDGSIIHGGAGSCFRKNRSLWYDIVDDSTLIQPARNHFEGFMQREFQGWKESGAHIDRIWTGIMGFTTDLLPHVGQVPDRDGQFIIAGFNGAGMLHILLTAQGLAKMINEDVVFEKTGIPKIFKTTNQRLEDERNMILERKA